MRRTILGLAVLGALACVGAGIAGSYTRVYCWYERNVLVCFDQRGNLVYMSGDL